MTNKQSHHDGTLSEGEYQWLVARGRGGFAVVKTCAAYVADTGRTWTGQLGIASDAAPAGPDPPGPRRCGRPAPGPSSSSTTAASEPTRRWPAGSSPRSTTPRPAPPQMSGGDVQQMVEDYVAAAVRAEQAGFDGVEVHGAHGFLLAQFLDRRNQRRDGYGGTLEHRMRALVEVLDGIRSATGDGFQVGVRLSPEAKGSPLDEGREVARQILTGGVVDFVDMSLRDVYATPHYNDDDEPPHRRLHRPAARRHGAERRPARSCPPTTRPGAWPRAPTSSGSASARSCTTTSPTAPSPTPASPPDPSRCPGTSCVPSSSGRRSWTTSPPTGTTSSPEPRPAPLPPNESAHSARPLTPRRPRP